MLLQHHHSLFDLFGLRRGLIYSGQIVAFSDMESSPLLKMGVPME
jgi:hypothetical protein